ncbi:hypothetical protein FRC06_004521 [Ceratobasidium sp. 370]|nr:hypothetical protein FRC06_004521 [Ceratobasidium sp. 370]
MSEARVRSKTGCLTCKNRKKKCDETRPQCQRCKRAGMECLGYEYLDNPVQKPRKPRAKCSAPAALEFPSAAGPSSQPAGASSAPTALGNLSLDLAPGVSWNDVLFPGDTWSFPSNIPGEAHSDLAAIAAFDNPLGISVLPGQSQIARQDSSAVWWNADLGLAEIFSQPVHGNANAPPNPPPEQNLGAPLLLESFLNDQPFVPGMSNAAAGGHSSSDIDQANLCQSLLGLGARTGTSVSSYSASQMSPSCQGSVWPSPVAERDDNSSTADDDSDTEGVMNIFGPTLALDRAVPSNSLPFVISSYLRWTIRTIFEPLKIVPRTRDLLIRRYMRSDDSRCGTMLIATIMESLLKNPMVGVGHFPALAVLQYRVNHKIAMIKSSQIPLPDAHGSDVLAALHDVCELISVQRLISPLSHFMKLLHDVAPVYREACSEPPGTPVHLPTKFLHPEPVLRLFPAMDIVLSLNTGRPMMLQYDVTQTSGGCERILQADNVGVRWMHGVPDHFLLMLARMNMLREEFAPNVDPEIVRELEAGIDSFKPALDESPDSYLRVARLMVQEAWRQVMYIYLHMGLCSVSSNHARVEKALKRFIRLLDGVKPGRTPDIFLVVPAAAAGVAAYKQRDRHTIRQRILGIHECSQVGTSGNDVLRILEELWAMSDVQGRPAIWADLRLACSRVTGIT